MREIRDYAAANPGASVTEVTRATHRSNNYRWITHPSNRVAVYRAEAAGLIVVDRRQRNRYRVYDAELVDISTRREAARDEYWRPGHP
jgi:hypothetical protein